MATRQTCSTVPYGRFPASLSVIYGDLWKSWAFPILPVQQRITEERKNQKNACQNGQKTILVTGHTHHPMTGDSASPYFNTGSCIHPAGITGIEIQSRSLTLVKWSTQAREDLTLQVTREILGGPICVDEIY